MRGPLVTAYRCHKTGTSIPLQKSTIIAKLFEVAASSENESVSASGRFATIGQNANGSPCQKVKIVQGSSTAARKPVIAWVTTAFRL
jgi:hypothetical protein